VWRQLLFFVVAVRAAGSLEGLERARALSNALKANWPVMWCARELIFPDLCVLAICLPAPPVVYL
jgi:hypothetical protein